MCIKVITESKFSLTSVNRYFLHIKKGKKMKIYSKVIGLMVIGWSAHAIDPHLLIDHVKTSITKASNGQSKLIPSILKIEGMSSSKGRYLLNNLCSLPGISYLEIGVHKGSTFISALYGNTGTLSYAVAIDDWSDFARQNKDFMVNTSLYIPKKAFTLIEHDCFSIDIKENFPKPINMYFYDGNHGREYQRKAFTYYNDILDDTFIALVDDWNFSDVEQGTKQAFQELGYTILFEELLPGMTLNDSQNWWNGMYVAVIQKNSKQ